MALPKRPLRVGDTVTFKGSELTTMAFWGEQFIVVTDSKTVLSARVNPVYESFKYQEERMLDFCEYADRWIYDYHSEGVATLIFID